MKNISLKIPQKTISSEIVFSPTFQETFQKLGDTIKGKPFLFVTDTNIEPFLEKALKDALFEVPTKNKCIIAAGEKHKTMESVQHILKACFEAHLDRGAILIAVGGGVIGDITGFAASLFMRGVSIIQIPTSLLAMVDASIGGKTGINTEYGKNLVGTLNQPNEIHVCYQWLQGLPEKEIKNGMCEMIKHGIINQKKHFEAFENLAKKCDRNEPESVKKTFLKEQEILIPESIAVKVGIVQRDPEESQERMKLNLGHTFGHGVEKLSNYETPHGISVAIGCVMAAQYAEEQELCKNETVDRIENVFHQLGIETTCPYAEDELWETMKYDKKRRGNTLNLILPTKIGEVVIYPVEI